MFVWDVNLLSQQLIVHLHPLHLLVTLLQSLVILTQLSNVVACFGQNASFTLEIKHIQKWKNVTQVIYTALSATNKPFHSLSQTLGYIRHCLMSLVNRNTS